MGKTRKQAERYARNIEVITGRKMLVFRLPAGSDSLAARAGLRFGTCFADEREIYVHGGAIFETEVSHGR